MKVARSFVALAAGETWVATRAGWAGDKLIGMASSADEDVSAIAKTMLTRAGDRSVPRVVAAIASGTPDLVGVLVSIGTDAASSALRELSASGDAEVAAEATAGLDRLERGRRQ